MQDRLIIGSELESLTIVYEWIEKSLANKISPKKLRDVLLVAQEMVTNSIIHGNSNDASKSVIIEMDTSETVIKIIIEDEGQGIKKLPSKEEAEELDYLAENGRGLKLAVLMTDSIKLDSNKIELLFIKE
ncbi:MAG TPA: ATP-binding protein [Sulfurimonas sp.]|nr:ATP-binding protein [Sulfurimonas sp.]